MKKIILLSILFSTFSSSAQLGVVTIKTRDSIPYDQWYSYKGRKYEHRVFYLNEHNKVDRILNQLLSPWDLTIDDGQTDADGDLFWVLDNDNGYYVTVYVRRKIIAPESSKIMIITNEI